MNKNDWAWDGIIKSLGLMRTIEAEGVAVVTADQLREWREPRLMVKMDQEQNRPQIFRNENLNVLAISESKFAVGRFEVFREIPQLEPSDLKIIDAPQGYETLQTQAITSETSALHAAFLSGMISSVYGQEMMPTTSGKTSAGDFEFTVSDSQGHSLELESRGARIEIDGGFEGEDVFAILEVKLNYSDNFNLRQLYYPYRLWADRISKDLVPTLLVYSNGIFGFYEYDFSLHEHLSSAELIGARGFAFASPFVTREEVSNCLQIVRDSSPDGVPFPQADSFEKLIGLMEILSQRPRTLDEIAQEFAFESRQADYYFNAARFLGLAENVVLPEGQARALTELGKGIMRLPPAARNLELIRRLCGIPVINRTLKALLDRDGMSAIDVAHANLREVAGQYGLGGETVSRRARTVAAWCGWVTNLIG